jgi:hypothetical protein
MATAPLSNLTATWNASGTTFTAIKMDVTDTASAAGSLLLDLQVGGASRFRVTKNGQVLLPAGTSSAPSLCFGDLNSGFYDLVDGVAFATANNTPVLTAQYNSALGMLRDMFLGWSTTQFGQSDWDVRLFRDAANTLAQRNGTNAQAFRVYGTYTDASNYQRVAITKDGLLSQAAGSGSPTTLYISQTSSASIYFQTNSTDRWEINNSGHFIARTDNTYDIGAAAATRPRSIFVGTSITAGDTVTAANFFAAATGLIVFTGRTGLNSDADGTLRLRNNAGTDFSRLQFGGTTSSFPALKRNSTALETKLADDSAYAPHAMQYLDVTDGITAPAAATGRARIYVDTADGDLKVIFADGTIKTLATDT